MNGKELLLILKNRTFLFYKVPLMIPDFSCKMHIFKQRTAFHFVYMLIGLKSILTEAKLYLNMHCVSNLQFFNYDIDDQP